MSPARGWICPSNSDDQSFSDSNRKASTIEPIASFEVIRLVLDESSPLNHHERVVLIALCAHRNRATGACFPSDALLARELRCSPRTVYSARISLRSRGVLRWTKSGRHHSNYYEILLGVLGGLVNKRTSHEVRSGQGTRHDMAGHFASDSKPLSASCRRTTEGTTEKNNILVKDPALLKIVGQTTALNGRAVTDGDHRRDHPTKPGNYEATPDFLKWWSLYPRKVGKIEAHTEWILMSDGEREAALDAVPRHTRQWEWEGRSIEMTPHPKTWLENKRWEDELDHGEPQRAPWRTDPP